MNGAMKTTDAAIDQALAEKRIVGAVVLIAQNGQAIYNRAAGLADRIRCRHGDAKSLVDDFGEGGFEAVISNTIVHHIPDPEPALGAMARLVAPGGTLMVRDLARPGSRTTGRWPGSRRSSISGSPNAPTGSPTLT